MCSDDRPAGAATVSADAFEVLSALLTGDWQVVDTAEPRHLRESTGIVAAYTQWHLERGLRSLRLVERRDRNDGCRCGHRTRTLRASHRRRIDP